MHYGAIDIGTNAARLLIGEVTNDRGFYFVKKISYTRIPLRLGMEVFENGKISSSKAEEFKKSIMAFKLIAEVFKVQDLRACATSAMREASNGKAVQKMIRKETGVDIEIIDGEEEADIIFSSFLLIDYDLSKPFIVIDVGGGSTEISIFYKGEKNNAKSFQIGTIRMLKNKVSETIWEDISEWLNAKLKPNKKYAVFATGGNINKIHKILGKKGSLPINIKEFKELAADLSQLSLDERIAKYQLRPDRADVIVPASEIFITILDQLGAKKMFVPKIGLSDGMIHQLHAKHNKKNN
jgi:exopolyphosphatase/guanosine-5'-triphosphate,3'-diphosphate pyrophosphatase